MRNPFKNYYYVVVVYAEGFEMGRTASCWKWADPRDALIHASGGGAGAIKSVTKL